METEGTQPVIVATGIDEHSRACPPASIFFTAYTDLRTKDCSPSQSAEPRVRTVQLFFYVYFSIFWCIVASSRPQQCAPCAYHQTTMRHNRQRRIETQRRSLTKEAAALLLSSAEECFVGLAFLGIFSKFERLKHELASCNTNG